MDLVTWVLESDVFPVSHEPLRNLIQGAGHPIVEWSDSWWDDGLPPRLTDSPVVFHGSLGNASKLAETADWIPGAFCRTEHFHCSQWYGVARDWLVHSDWEILPAIEFVRTAEAVGEKLGSSERLFVRPDSPLKPFSGRVVETESVTLASLDHGFYFDDELIPVVAAPIRTIDREWRFVVVRSEIIAGSAYEASTRSGLSPRTSEDARSFAADVARALPAPDDVYVLDVCETDGELRLLELNPFGGADLYNCDAAAVVRCVSQVALDAWNS